MISFYFYFELSDIQFVSFSVFILYINDLHIKLNKFLSWNKPFKIMLLFYFDSTCMFIALFRLFTIYLWTHIVLIIYISKGFFKSLYLHWTLFLCTIGTYQYRMVLLIFSLYIGLYSPILRLLNRWYLIIIIHLIQFLL